MSTNTTDLASYIQENFGANANYVEGLLERYKADPNSVDESWRVFFGDLLGTHQANYDGRHAYGEGEVGVYRERTTPVASFPPNAFGLYDCHGNLWEWCEDDASTARPMRGGSWSFGPWSCRSAVRRWGHGGLRKSYCGCRLVLCPD